MQHQLETPLVKQRVENTHTRPKLHQWRCYFWLSSTILLLLPWISFFGMRTEFTSSFFIHSFPLQFVQTLGVITDEQLFEDYQPYCTRLFLAVEIIGFLVASSRFPTEITAMISSQILCWLLLLETVVADEKYLSQFVLMSFIFYTMIHHALNGTYEGNMIDRYEIIMYSVAVILMGKIVIGSCCSKLKHSIMKVTERMVWFILFINICALVSIIKIEI